MKQVYNKEDLRGVSDEVLELEAVAVGDSRARGCLQNK